MLAQPSGEAGKEKGEPGQVETEQVWLLSITACETLTWPGRDRSSVSQRCSCCSTRPIVPRHGAAWEADLNPRGPSKEDKKSVALWGKKAEDMFHCSSPFMIRYWSEVHWIHLKDCYWVHCLGSRLQIKNFKDFVNSSTGYKALRRKPGKRYKKEKETQRDRNSCTRLKQDVTARCSL